MKKHHLGFRQVKLVVHDILDMKNHVRLVFLFLVSSIMVSCSKQELINQPSQLSQPNIVIILMDDMGYNDLGIQTAPSQSDFYPNSGPKPIPGYSESAIPEPNIARLMTPRIDSIAADGMRMTSFHTTRLCSPSRASLLTGRYASRMNMDRVFHRHTENGFSTEEVTLAEVLRENGYYNGLIGKWHLGYNATKTIPFQMMPTRSGFHEFFGFPWSNDGDDYSLLQNEDWVRDIGYGESEQNGLTWEITESALNFLDRAANQDQPFFLQFNQIMTHIPCWPSNQQYQNADGTVWPVFKGKSGESYYYDALMEIDHSVGRVLDKLDTLGVADNTIVIFTSDNGPWLNHHTFGRRVIDKLDSSVGSAYPLKDGKFTTWEGGTRVPFLVRWPERIKAGSVSNALSGLIDIAPTLVSIVGDEMPDDRKIDGINIWPIWSGEQSSTDRTYALFNDGEAEGVLKGNWKLHDGSLYNLENDIQELVNVSSKPANQTIFEELDTFRHQIQASAATDVIPLGLYSNYEVEFSGNDIVISESGTASVKLRLSHNPGKTTKVTTARYSGNIALFVSSGAILTFDDHNWFEWQTVEFTVSSEIDRESGGATFRVTLSDLDVVRELFVFDHGRNLAAR